MAITRGIKSSGGTDFVTGFPIIADESNTDLNTVFSGVNNIIIIDSNVAVGANIGPTKVGDYSLNAAEMQTEVSPGAVGAESLATNLTGELARLRYMIRLLTGGTYWYSKAVAGTGPAVSSTWFTGDIRITSRASADPGWIMLDDGTIGSAASGASTRANADTSDLFAHLWTTYADFICPVSTGRGASAAADYAANKTIRLPLFVARQLGIAGVPAASNEIDYLTGTMGLTGSTPRAGVSTTVFYISPLLSSTVNADYPYRIRFTSGANAGTEHDITAYDGTEHKIIVGVAFGAIPALGDAYVIYPVASQTTLAILPFEQFSGKDDVYNGYTIATTGGTGSGQTRTISDYDGSARLVTVGAAWTTQPDYTTTFSIYKTIPTRTNAERIGSDLIIPTIDSSPNHTHPGEMALGNNATGHQLDTMLPGSHTSGTTYTTIDGAVPSRGNNVSISQYAPTVFVHGQMKL